MRVVIDPNVLLSALIAPGGASDQAVRRIVVHATPIASPELLDRFVQRAREERFRRWFSVAGAEELAGQLAELAEVAEDAAHVPAVGVADPSDDYLVALARRRRADRLLTGDRGIHRALDGADDLRVVSPSDLLGEFPADADSRSEGA
ncbi:putative toxin-antitoxin system toxin component, PIN family [Egibacter rhizosphaerae]|uniref:putative toxin-antitoxin system toxin component, PIN family n=1 Tax=Egibacter rhizosphaerae TaxID=1670831 RepID=UPI0013F14F45|nr:putative toxin-antitoxin system toxin component, PIN family [Egibacter rhizosphaerae]